MIARENYEGGKTPKIMPLHSRPNFDWNEWKAYLFMFAMTVLLGMEVLTMDCSLLVKSAAVKTARIAKYAMANATLIFAIGQAAILCDEARAITVGHQLSEFRGNAFVLLRLIEERFTLKKIQNLAKLLVDLNGLICLAHETPAMVLDRFNKIVLGITAIDATQLPTELQLITILKNAISNKFELLNAMLLTMANLTLAQLKEKFQGWEAKFEIGGGAAQAHHSESPKHPVANFAGASPAKNWKDGKQKKKPFDLVCWECDQPGHLARECPNLNHSHRSDSSPGRKRNAGSANGSGGSRGLKITI